MHLFKTKKKHQDTHAHNFTTQFTELTYRFKDLLPNCFTESENNYPTSEKHATHSLNIAPFHFSN